MNKEKARFNMVEQQIRPWQVSDPAILNLMATLPREFFVPEAYRSMAFADLAIPLPHKQQMFVPREEARLLQSLELTANDTILEVGTGTGFLTALLASLGKKVFSLDLFPEFITEAEKKLKQMSITNVELEAADAAQGWPHHAPYDVIVVTASIEMPPKTFLKQLANGGRLFTIEGEQDSMVACRYLKTNDKVSKSYLFETHSPRLRNAEKPKAFVF
ncbi:protein-L-isoaspartate O-methyltransferase [Pleionea sp. CnH1-48]|uniref:protein-L-isoaspartate O-methyltransferase family protein n=1 Tax=Pleionea sp. CnH1-48 TaxID=2954494 RepID=UPI002097C314|nr:protein-L-isoaspartate O-methyltransferase [Pleionea sp. CnH1-48]MCO7227406.1 protein-L-isoaspartate O-methyltransferase [Pleionea sp. CnH1-48]